MVAPVCVSGPRDLHPHRAGSCPCRYAVVGGTTMGAGYCYPYPKSGFRLRIRHSNWEYGHIPEQRVELV